MALSPAALAFLRKHVDSVVTMEVLSALVSSGEALLPGEIAARVGVSEGQAGAAAAALAGSGASAAAAHGAYRFTPASEAERLAAGELVGEYTLHRVEVLNAIYSAGLERLRAFADAFRVRRP